MTTHVSLVVLAIDLHNEIGTNSRAAPQRVLITRVKQKQRVLLSDCRFLPPPPPPPPSLPSSLILGFEQRGETHRQKEIDSFSLGA